MNDKELAEILRKKPNIETERLILMPFDEKYAADMYDYASRETVTEYVTWYPHSDVAATREFMKAMRKLWKKGQCADWIIILRECGRMIGTCGFVKFSLSDRRGEIGYCLSPNFWGNGYMTEAVKSVIGFGFEKLGLNRIEAQYIAENRKSKAVMLRCGMTPEGVMRGRQIVKGEPRDIGICAVLNEK